MPDQIPGENCIFEYYSLEALKKSNLRFHSIVLHRCFRLLISNCIFAVLIEASGVAGSKLPVDLILYKLM